MVPNLRVRIGNVDMKNPVICASGEHVLTEAGIRAALDQGAAMVVAKSTNESAAARTQLAQTDYALMSDAWQPAPWGQSAAGNLLCRSGLQPRAAGDWIAALAKLDADARGQDAYVAASIILADLDSAVNLAKMVEAAGIRILEFNVGTPYGDEASHGGVTTERASAKICEQVAMVCGAVRIPVWVKLTGQSENVAALAQAAKQGGAAAVTMIGRMLGMLPDLETMAPVLGTNLGYGGPWALPLTCHWLAKTRKHLGADFPLIGTNGARSGEDVARMLLAGASAVEMCSAVMTGGFGVLGGAIAGLTAYLAGKKLDAAALRGLAADRVGSYDGLAQRPGHWQKFVPPETLAGA
jgi:dihydroorotate dehydrogenase (NAD+) catalytic subunit